MDCEVMLLSSKRLKREDCFHPKHDSLFYEWKVLVGPSDWEDHSLWKGAERYRVQNLPNCYSCPGLYELGLVISGAHSGSKIGNLDPVPFYLGQTGNVRTRLQCYGREGAHLENNGNSYGQVNDYVLQQGHGAFSEAFSRGYTIAYRWAPMKNKEEAEKTETRLLNTYDYALNKGNNGVRRLGDVFQKLQGSTSSGVQFLTLLANNWMRDNECQPMDLIHWLQQCPFGNLKLSSVFDTPYGNSTHQSVHTPYGNSTHQSVPYRQIKKKSVPAEQKKKKKSFPAEQKIKKKSVPCRSVVIEYYSPTCEATLDDGSACRRAPVEGRKRCWQHKGMWGYDTGASTSDICAASTANGSICRRTPVYGRERCEKHRGKRAAF